MIEAAPAVAIAMPAAPPVDEIVEAEAVVSRWAPLIEDVRFFAICYLAGLIVFLVMLS